MGERDHDDLTRPLPSTSWVNIEDHASAVLDRIAAEEGFHPLDVEDCRHRNQMAKVTTHETYTFAVIKDIHFDEAAMEIEFDDFDLFITPTRLVTVQESRTETLAKRVAERLRTDPAPPPDWRIVHALIDTAVDDYLPVLDRLGEIIDTVETDVLNDPSPRVLQRIITLKRVLIEFRRNSAAMREVANHLVRTAPPGDEKSLYMRDVYDHLIRILDFIETYRDLVSGCLDIYLSAIANRTNEIVKVLTIWGTIALPLIVITGFYGMNIDLPFAKDPRAILFVVVLMIASIGGILVYFRRRRWM